MSVQTIPPKELDELRKTRPVELIDVRAASEYETMHVDGAKLIPLDKLDPKALMAERGITGGTPVPQGKADGGPVYVICHSGMRGGQACEKFMAAGFTNVFNVEGGTMGWKNAGLALVYGKKTISLERQTRIVIGTGVLAGVLLGWLVHPAWLILPGFMGCGLIVAGVTDTCLLGLLIAKLPWNRAKGACCGVTQKA